GLVPRAGREQELRDAVGRAIERDRADRRERQELADLRRRYDSLTPRERDVMGGVVAGRLNKQIAAEFGTSQATVKEQRGQVMLKMQADSLAELVRIATRLHVPTRGSGSAGMAADGPVQEHGPPGWR